MICGSASANTNDEFPPKGMSRPVLSGSPTFGLVTGRLAGQKECTSATIDHIMADVEEYLAHIGYTGSKEPTVANLAALHSSHLLAVVFENISCILGEKIKLDPDWIFEKIVKRGRGGELFIYFSMETQKST